MKIILATGIYPPDIGGPATYVAKLAEELAKLDHVVEVVTYKKSGKQEIRKSRTIHSVSSSIPILRWFLYAKKLRKVGADADIVYAFSSVSCGVPLWLSGLKKPKRVLRLGGDFLWERYTDMGGKKSLREWYRLGGWGLGVGGWLLRQFHHIVFSTAFQQDIYEKAYRKLPQHSVVENALQIDQVVPFQHHIAHTPFRLLCMARFVRFKNIPALLQTVALLSDCRLTLVGEGPLDDELRRCAAKLGIEPRVQFVAPLHGKEKFDVFGSHDLLVIPSLTDISPNTALEARSVGLPVLLTKENGLSRSLIAGITEAGLSTPEHIAEEIDRVRQGYSLVSEAASQKIAGRSWQEVTEETIDLFDCIQN